MELATFRAAKKTFKKKVKSLRRDVVKAGRLPPIWPHWTWNNTLQNPTKTANDSRSASFERSANGDDDKAITISGSKVWSLFQILWFVLREWRGKVQERSWIFSVEYFLGEDQPHYRLVLSDFHEEKWTCAIWEVFKLMKILRSANIDWSTFSLWLDHWLRYYILKSLVDCS